MTIITAEIKQMRIKNLHLCSELEEYSLDSLGKIITEKGTGAFVLKINDQDKLAVSIWVSPKRTRSYPYARVYDTLCYRSYKKVAIIPVMKDEGYDGERDYIQWDTISLMSLLQVHVVLSYYVDAERNPRYKNKITNQKMDIAYIKSKLIDLLNWNSDALHYNLAEVEKISDVLKKAIESYRNISNKLKVQMHSFDDAMKRIQEISKNLENFKNLSRELSQEAQKREVVTIQPKEKIEGKKGAITIKNYLGGLYYFTVDEIEIDHKNKEVKLIEVKHTNNKELPSLNDVKDGLLKMILYTNIEDKVKIGQDEYLRIPVLKLSSSIGKRIEDIPKKPDWFDKLIKEAKCNNFRLMYNNYYIV